MRGLKFIILGVAVVAGAGAVALVQSELKRARDASVYGQDTTAEVQKTRVLVANRDMSRGHPVKPEDLKWQEWPLELVSESFIDAQSRPQAREKATDYLVKSAIVAGEPITESKLIKINHPGVMSAMVRKGMRAVAIQVSLETGAGGFILPGDYVDVILTRDEEVETRRADGSYREEEVLITNTLLRTVRVMAIDTIFQSEGEATTSTKRTATLEVDPEMAELLALAEKAGRITLALRSLAELVGADGEVLDDPTPTMVFDVASFAAGSLPDQIKDQTADYGARAPGAASPPAPAPAPFVDNSVLIVRGGVKQKAPIQ